MKISKKAAIVMMLIAVLPICVISIATYHITKATITDYVYNNMESVANVQKGRIESEISMDISVMDLITSRPTMRIALNRYMTTGEKPQQEIGIRILSEARAAVKNIRDISILNIDGKVVASTNASLDGKDMSRENYFIKGRTGYSMDVFSLLDKEAVRYLSCPLLHEGRQMGVLVIESTAKTIESIAANYEGLGKTGETTIARRDKNGDALFIVPLRFAPASALTKSIPKKNTEVTMTQALLKKEQKFYDTVDYRGKHVIATTRYIRETDWGMVVKIDKEEAFSPLYYLRKLFIVFTVIVMVIVMVVSHFISRSITNPIIRLTGAARRIRNGHVHQMPDIISRDEIGFLAETFDEMTKSLLDSKSRLEKEIQEHLKLEEQNKTILSTSIDGFVITDTERKILQTNKAYCNMTGYTEEELLQMGIKDIETLEPPEVIKRRTKEITETGGGSFESKHKRKDGRFIDVEISVNLIKKDNLFFAFVRDITARKLIEEEIKEINLNLQRKVEEDIAKNDNMMNGYSYCRIIHDNNNHPDDFIYLEVNKSFETITGLKRADVISKKVTEVFPHIKEIHPELIEIYGNVASGGAPVNYELLFKPLNIWLSINVYSSKEGYFVTLFENTTERRNMENALRDSEEKYRLLFTHENDAIYLCDAETLEFIDSNDAWSNLYGYSRDEMEGKSISIISAEPEKTIETKNEAVISGSARVPHRLHRRKDGTIFSVETSVGVFMYKGRNVLCSISRDITQRIRLESQNEYNARLFDIFFEYIPDSIVLLDKDFNFMRVSKSYANTCQRDVSDLIGRNHFEIYPSNFQIEAEETKRLKLPYSLSERPFIFPDHPEWGTTYWDIRLVPVMDKDGDVELFLFTLKEVTEQKQNKDRLVSLNENLIKRVEEEVEKSRTKDHLMYEQARHISMGELLVNISHHWRQPLCGVALAVQDIKDAYLHNELDEAYINKNIGIAISEIKSLSDTINNFGKFYITGKSQMEFNISDEINRANTLISGYVKEKAIVIDKELDESLTTQGFHNEFAQVILNILSNVKDKFEQKNLTSGIIKIRLYKDDATGKKIITITDNGGGIPDDIIDKVFDPYFTTKDKSRGTGMGLYTAKVIIENKMNGTISIRNIDERCELRIEI